MSVFLILAQWFACLAIPLCVAAGRMDWLAANVCLWDLCRQWRGELEKQPA